MRKNEELLEELLEELETLDEYLSSNNTCKIEKWLDDIVTKLNDFIKFENEKILQLKKIEIDKYWKNNIKNILISILENDLEFKNEDFLVISDESSNNNNTKDNKIKDKVEKLKNIPIGMIISTLFSGLIVSGVIYYETKKDTHNAWCIQEVKNFNYNLFGKKDLAILIDKCKEQVIKYEMLDDTLSSTQNIDKFSSVINQLYIHNKINDTFITDFTDKALFKKLLNSNYNFDNTWVNKSNNLPILDIEINRYLQFTKTILFKKYESKQISNYFFLFVYLFREDEFFTNKYVPLYLNHFKEEKQNIEFKVNQKFEDLIEIVNNSGKIDKNEIIIDSNDEFIIALKILFNSYKNRNKKEELILLLSEMTNNIKKVSEIGNSIINNENQVNIFNTRFFSEKILQLLWHELRNYELDKSDLSKIFKEYLMINNYIDVVHQRLSYKLLYNLFDTNFNSNTNLFNELFFESYLNKEINLNKELLNYLAMKKQVPLLLNILDSKNLTQNLKRDIFIAILVGQKQNPYSFDYEKILIKLVKNEKNQELQKIMLNDLLSFNKVEVVEYAIDFIKKNETYYLKELNNSNYFSHGIYYESIFGLLSENKPLWEDKKQEIREKKFQLFIKFLSKMENRQNKLIMLEYILSFISDDIFLIEELKKQIQKQKDPILKREMIKKLSEIK